jgi:hypothetical protein
MLKAGARTKSIPLTNWKSGRYWDDKITQEAILTNMTRILTPNLSMKGKYFRGSRKANNNKSFQELSIQQSTIQRISQLEFTIN